MDGQGLHPLLILAAVLLAVVMLEIVHSRRWLVVLTGNDSIFHPMVRNATASPLHLLVPANLSRRRYILVDCGANRGDAARVISSRLQHTTGGPHWVYSFEPNPYYAPFLRPLKSHTHIPKACWISDGVHDFHLLRCGRGEHRVWTLLEARPHCRSKGANHSSKVQTVDIAQWMIRNLLVTDFVLLRMNIVGAEYEVLTHMHKVGSLKLVDRISVERLGDVSGERPADLRLRALLADYGLVARPFLTASDACC
eukprot:GGOE01019145.1.p1 GENE.GGOE01019145.1~~GGOE01019145.1.p1  ORF type:complete len:253 (-),score=62.05 GGOE01019145.1:363-1121(-)